MGPPRHVDEAAAASYGPCGHGAVTTEERNDDMKVWIDQDLCTGDGLCEEIAPAVFTLLDDGLAYVKQEDSSRTTREAPPAWRRPV